MRSLITMLESTATASLRRRLVSFGAGLTLLLPSAAVAAVPAVHAVIPSVASSPAYARATRAAGATLFTCQLPTTTFPCYGPQQIQAAYGVDKLQQVGDTGRGRTIVIIDAFGNPFIATDLQIFDATWGLPDPVFKVFAPQGAPSFDFTNADMVGWSGEISLDVQWAHAIAPAAAIDLVLAKSDQDPDILAATKWAVDHNLGDVISQSFGEAESCVAPGVLPGEHAVFAEATREGITLLASSGDDGAVQPTCDNSSFLLSASSPASDPLVTGVGGTNLTADLASGAYQSETAWGDGYGESGGGFSTVYGRPAYQFGVSGTQRGARGVPDVAYNAGVFGGVLTHWGVGDIVVAGESTGTDPTSAWIFGGTSAGSPQWAGLVALADQLGHHRIGFINDTLYGLSQFRFLYGIAFHDITTGDNMVPPFGGYSAAKGWDPVTGLGTPKANVLVPLLAFSH